MISVLTSLILSAMRSNTGSHCRDEPAAGAIRTAELNSRNAYSTQHYVRENIIGDIATYIAVPARAKTLYAPIIYCWISHLAVTRRSFVDIAAPEQLSTNSRTAPPLLVMRARARAHINSPAPFGYAHVHKMFTYCI